MPERAAQKEASGLKNGSAMCHRCVLEEKKSKTRARERIETQQVSSSYSFAPAPMRFFSLKCDKLFPLPEQKMLIA